MSAIVNDRDLLLQAAPVRFVAPTIPIEQVEGLPDALEAARGIRINASADTFISNGAGGTNPATITLTAVLGGLTGTVSWSVVAGSATLTPSGNTCVVNGASVLGYSVTVRAQLTSGSTTHEAQYTLNKLGALSAQETVNLNTQVTGQLAAGNITGLGALALLNTVNLNTQTTGALNGMTQVTNLGTLAYANAIAANQIGAGTLAAGVIYTGSLSANQITTGTMSADRISGGEISGTVTLRGPYFYSSFGLAYLGMSSSDYGVAVDVGKVVRINWPLGGTYGSRIVQADGATWRYAWIEDPVGGPQRAVRIRFDG